MGTDPYPGIRLKRRLADAGFFDAMEKAIRTTDYAKMKELVERVAASPEEAQEFVGVVFTNPKHYDRVISDRHYQGKTVLERLASDGLLDLFTAAVQAKDAARMVRLLEQVASSGTSSG